MPARLGACRVAWLGVGTSTNGQPTLGPKAPAGLALPFFAEERFSQCGLRFSIYPAYNHQSTSNKT